MPETPRSRRTRQWWLDEVVHAGAEHLDAAYVAGYERKAGYDPSGDLEILRARGLGKDSVVVDLGAGTGVFALAAARECRRVVAVDVASTMTKVIRERVASLGLGNVEVVEAGLLSYEHEGEPADFVFTRNVLHHLPDFWKAVALARIAKLLRPRGVLRLHDLVFDVEPGDVGTPIDEWIAGGNDDPQAGYTPTELAEHVRLEYSTYSWLFEPMLERTGFKILDRSYVRSAYGAYLCEVAG